MRHRWYQSLVTLLLLICPSGLVAQSSATPAEPAAEHLKKAQAFLQQKRPDLAIPELKAAVALDPGNVDAQANLGVLLYFQGHPDQAIPYFRTAVASNASLSKIQGLLGLAEARAADYSHAAADLSQAFPSLPDGKFKTEVGLQLVTLDTQAGNLQAAADVLAVLESSDSKNAEVLYAAYRTYSDLATTAMLSLSLAAPNSAQMHQVMANEEVRISNDQGAIDQYRKALAINPHLPGANFELAQLLNASPDPKLKAEAPAAYKAALADNPNDATVLVALGNIDLTAGNDQAALEEFTKASQLRPDSADARLGLAETLIATDQRAKAEPLLEEAVRLDPTNPTAHYRLATLYRQQGKQQQAREQLEEYKNLRAEKDKLAALYKQVRVQPVPDESPAKAAGPLAVQPQPAQPQ